MAKKAAPKTKPAAKPTKAKKSPSPITDRIKWFDEQSQSSVIAEYAQQMTSFVEAMADGVIEDHEVQAQETRVVELMKEIEPMLDDKLHPKVTQLLCEVTVYDMMQTIQALQQERMRTSFRC